MDKLNRSGLWTNNIEAYTSCVLRAMKIVYAAHSIAGTLSVKRRRRRNNTRIGVAPYNGDAITHIYKYGNETIDIIASGSHLLQSWFGGWPNKLYQEAYFHLQQKNKRNQTRKQGFKSKAMRTSALCSLRNFVGPSNCEQAMQAASQDADSYNEYAFCSLDIARIGH